MPESEDVLAWDRQLCLGQWQWRRKSWRQLQEIQWKRKESKRTSETPQVTWLGGAQRGSLWLCYAETDFKEAVCCPSAVVQGAA